MVVIGNRIKVIVSVLILDNNSTWDLYTLKDIIYNANYWVYDYVI